MKKLVASNPSGDVFTPLGNRIADRILSNDNFENVAYVCEDFETFVDEVAEWGIQSIAKVDFDDPELDLEALDDFFGSFGCTPANPHPCSRRYA